MCEITSLVEDVAICKVEDFVLYSCWFVLAYLDRIVQKH